GAVIGSVALIAEAGIHRVLLTTVIARRADHHDSSLPGRLDRLAKRIGGIALADGMAYREVHHFDIVGRLFGDRPLDACQNSADRSLAPAVQYAHIHQIGAAGDTIEGAVVAGAGRLLAIAGDDSGDMSPMPAKIL